MIPAGEWERCSPWIEAALEHAGGEYVLDDVRVAVEAGDAHFWPGRNAVMVTEFFCFPRSKALLVWLAGGDMAEIVGPMRTEAEAWAKMQGCSRALIAGRPGWGRALRDAGYEPMWTTVTKVLK